MHGQSDGTCVGGRMTLISRHPLLWDVYLLIQFIEKCGCSEEVTNAVIAAGNLLKNLDKYIQEKEGK